MANPVPANAPIATNAVMNIATLIEQMASASTTQSDSQPTQQCESCADCVVGSGWVLFGIVFGSFIFGIICTILFIWAIDKISKREKSRRPGPQSQGDGGSGLPPPTDQAPDQQSDREPDSGRGPSSASAPEQLAANTAPQATDGPGQRPEYVIEHQSRTTRIAVARPEAPSQNLVTDDVPLRQLSASSEQTRYGISNTDHYRRALHSFRSGEGGPFTFQQRTNVPEAEEVDSQPEDQLDVRRSSIQSVTFLDEDYEVTGRRVSQDTCESDGIDGRELSRLDSREL